MPQTFTTLRSILLSAVAALALLTVTSAASAPTAQAMNAAFMKYGFEYREGERPYGLPIKAKASVQELRSDLIKPPFESWRAQLESFKDKGVAIEAHCDFDFVRLDGKYYQLYFKDRDSYKTSTAPSCEVRRSDYRHTE